MSAERVQVLLDPVVRERIRTQSVRDGVSMSAWIRDAAVARLQAAEGPWTIERQHALWAACDAPDGEPEPDWSEAKDLLDRPRASVRAALP